VYKNKNHTKIGIHLNMPRSGQLSVKKRKFVPSNDMLPPPPFAVSNWSSLYALAQQADVTPFQDCLDLPRLLPALKLIDNMVGLNVVKNSLVDRVLFFCQRSKMHKKKRLNHMILVGPPGCGKTTLAYAIACLFNLMAGGGDTIVHGTRQNMIGSYVGHTAKNTQTVIDSALGGVLLIDEAYALGDGRSRDSSDSFSKACLDTLNRNLTEQGDNFTCIIIGYADELDRDFFSVNPGLRRRFPFEYVLEKYSAAELCSIFQKMCESTVICPPLDVLSFFTKNFAAFKNHGASIAEFVDKIELVYFREFFGKKKNAKITKKHMDKALNLINKNNSDTIETCYNLYM
jgi:SpoVK/Ycf46/Vps4 family AAA+-type ATPase